MKNLQIQLSALRENNSKLNVEVNCLKALRHEAEAMSKKDKRGVEKFLIERRDLKHNLSTFETTKKEIITELNKLKLNINTLNTSVSDLPRSLNVERIRIDQLNGSRVQGVVSLKDKTNIINDKVKDFDNELNPIKNNVNTYSKAISDLRITNIEQELKAMDKTNCSYTSTLKTNQEHCSTQTKSYGTINSES
jgi:chromosome segregation ATPase